jgi:hypothetical protein
VKFAAYFCMHTRFRRNSASGTVLAEFMVNSCCEIAVSASVCHIAAALIRLR